MLCRNILCQCLFWRLGCKISKVVHLSNMKYRITGNMNRNIIAQVIFCMWLLMIQITVDLWCQTEHVHQSLESYIGGRLCPSTSPDFLLSPGFRFAI